VTNGFVPSTRRSPLIATRLSAPSTSERCTPRPRLLDALVEGAGRRLTVIHGPAGFGKTTLAVQWRSRLLEEGKPVAWLSMDKDDNDPLRFLAYLIEAIRSAEPSLGADLVSLLESQSDQIAGFLLTELVNQLHDYGEDFYLFLDDWHLVKDKKSEEAIVFLLEHAPANLHLVITSRSRPSFPMLKLMLQNEVTEIHGADLRFDLQESEYFFRDLAITEADLQTLLAKTEGWVAALQLAMISLRSTGDREGLFRWISGKHHAVGDYLTENVLNSLPEDLLHFLLNTSILGRFCGPLCSAVTGEANGMAILERAEHLQLFIIPLDDEREWFRYHHLFASYLQRRLERDHPERIRSLHLTAADWFAAQGLAEEAVTHALAAGDNARAINIVEDSAMWFVERSYMATLLGLVGKLPPEELADRPVLQAAIAWSHCLIHHPEQALGAVRHIETYLVAHDRTGDDDELALETKVIRACIEIYADRIDGLEELVRPVLAKADSQHTWVVSVAANILTYGLMHSHQYSEAIELQRWTKPYHEKTSGPFSQIYGHCFAGMAEYERGHYSEAEASFKDALYLAQRRAGDHSHAARLAGAMLGKIYYEYNQIAEAESLLEDSIALGVEGGVVDFSLASYIPYARLIALRGDEDRALQILDEGEQTARLLCLERLTACIAAERARLHASTGNLPPTTADAAAPLAKTTFPNYANGIMAEVWEAERITAVRLALAQGKPRDAHALLDPLFDYTTLKGQHCLTRTALILRALAHDLNSDPRAAEEAMIGALEACNAPRAIRPFLDEGPRVVSILERVHERYRRQLTGAPTRPVQTQIERILVTARQQAPARTAAPGQTLAPEGAAHAETTLLDPLKVREIEVLRLVGEGKSNKEIARYLGIGIDTVKWYLKAIYGKLGVSRRTQAIGEARRLGLIA